jgi:hypothetical protein
MSRSEAGSTCYTRTGQSGLHAWPHHNPMSPGVSCQVTGGCGNGSTRIIPIFFVDAGYGPIGITARHVIAGYREAHANNPDTACEGGGADLPAPIRPVGLGPARLPDPAGAGPRSGPDTEAVARVGGLDVSGGERRTMARGPRRAPRLMGARGGPALHPRPARDTPLPPHPARPGVRRPQCASASRTRTSRRSSPAGISATRRVTRCRS